jgi:hypothetical protein
MPAATTIPCTHHPIYTTTKLHHSSILLYILHCLGDGMSDPSGSISDWRNVLPFISFVVAITNSTSAAKGGKQYLAKKLSVQIGNETHVHLFTSCKLM